MGLHIHLDALGGVAGDMFCAALLSARPELTERVRADCLAVLPAGSEVALVKGLSGGLAASRFDVRPAAAARGHTRYVDHHRRISDAALAGGTAQAALAILHRLAEAEADIHNVALNEVHFHEVGDWDSLADVVAAGSIIGALPHATWSVSALPLGSGTLKTAHGLLPVPAPATAKLLEGFECRDDGIDGERVTPTGAAILASLALAPRRPARLIGSGTGAGTRTLPGIANVLRALVFEPAETALHKDTVSSLSFEIDDMTGEELGLALERLRHEDGVLDVTMTQSLGKKGRPVASIRLLARPDRADAVAHLCFEETTTLGLRLSQQERLILRRSAQTHAVGASTVRLKTAERPSGVTRKVESDDLAEIGGLAARRAVKAEVENAE